MSRKILVTILIILIIITIGVVGWWFLLREKGDNNINYSNQNNLNEVGGLPQENNLNENNIKEPAVVANLTPQEKDKAEIEGLSRFFVEMMGTYSPDANFQNIIDLQDFMTPKMKTSSDELIMRNLNTTNQESLTTNVLDINMLSQTTSTATIMMNTRPNKINGNDEKNYDQKVRVELMKQGTVWKVDNIIWQ